MEYLKKYTIIKDRVKIFEDFTLNLLHYIYHYYLDKDTLKYETDIKNYYNFCFMKVCSEYEKEELYFSSNGKLFNYFYRYYYDHFFTTKNEPQKSFFVKFWKKVFNIDNQRNENYLKIMIELYKIFDESITIDKNILELV
ncbi:MAG: hypothetical protein ACOC33_01015 [bacterium]